MFKFLFVMFFFFILLVFLMGFSILRTFKNMLFGSGSSSGKKGEQRRQTSSYAGGQQSSHDTNEEDYATANRKKIFAKDEGEYVDFEEVK
ncbi:MULTISPECIES: DUF4834 family protein [Parabacteroides]|jgi:hypothetical protein|uniref:DUF4834 family protein n=1 Tax=Parabacteroides TaxID=375288 RepID=UPI000617417E|nr:MULTISPECIES: DUF4834 family protein [Parabacteroides]KKB46420.1 hypothetical protein HMPREF1212_03914 [Parabacteroides sp. HGS0025]MCD8135319.1 DUF4834 family protein [Parabacteroides gordonii]RGP17164.1 DUF4834 family protein [Parabacteroides gordonii]